MVVIKRVGALLGLGIMLLGFSAIPVQTQEDNSKIHNMTIEQAVELALENNLQVKIAQADKKKKDAAYAYAKTISRTIKEYQGSSFQERLAEDLKPRIAERQGEQAERLYQVTLNGVKIMAESAFYELLKAKENLEIAENALKRADEQLKLTNIRFEVGSAAKIEVLKAEAAQAGTRASLTAAQNNYKQKMLELNKVLGIDLQTVVEPQGSFSFNREEFVLQQLLDRAMLEESSLIQAEDNAAVAQWTYEFIKNYYTPSYGDAKTAEQDAVMADLMLSQTRNNVITTVNQSYLSLKAAEEQYEYLKKAVELSYEAYRLTQLSYELGMSTLDELQKASDDVKVAEAQLSECIYNYNILKACLKNCIYSLR